MNRTPTAAAVASAGARELEKQKMGRIKDLVECMRVKPLLQSYLDGELDDEQGATMVARHLEACHRCGKVSDSIEALKDKAAQLRKDPSPEQIERIERVIDELAERPAGPTESEK